MIEILSIKGVAVAAALAGAVIVASKINTPAPAPTTISQPVDKDTIQQLNDKYKDAK